MFADIVGWLGTLLVLIAYFQVNTDRWSAENRIFQIFNLLGSIGLVYKACSSAVWPSVMLNFFWACIAIVALYRARTRKCQQPKK